LTLAVADRIVRTNKTEAGSMSAQPQAQAQATARDGVRRIRATINYAGRIEGRARFDVADMSRTNIAFDPVEAEVTDARSLDVPPSLDREGFALFEHRSAVCRSRDMAEIDRVYHQEVARLIAEVTGADLVLPQRTGLLVRRGERSKEPTWAKPARFAHLDYTHKSVRDFLGWIKTWEATDPAPYTRIAIIQTWRATSPPPQDNTLALGDARSFSPGDTRVFDAVLGDTGAAGEVFESRLVLARPDQRWLYYPSLREDELVMFKAYDSDPDRPSDVPHTAIDDPAAGPDAHPRESLEARFFAYFR
jgi:hypothetical protein